MQGKLNIYKASAGSGKTFALTCDYITLLLSHKAEEGGEAFKHILAVTFTNKATTEMKQRILQHLYGIAYNLSSSDDMLEKVSEKIPGVRQSILRERAAIALKSILHGYDRFSVTTIDSFFQTLLTNLAHELGLPANFRIDLGDKEALHAAVERLICNSAGNSREFKWLFDYIRNRMDDGERWDVTREAEDFAQNLLRAEYLSKEDELSHKLSDDKFMNDYRKMLTLKETKAKNALIALATDLDNDISSRPEGYAEFKSTKTLRTFISNCIKVNGEAPSATVCKMAEDCDAWYKQDKIKALGGSEQAQNLKLKLSKLIKLQEESSYIINSCTLSKKMLNPMRLLGRIDELLKEVNRENNRFLLASTPILFEKLVGSIDAPFVFEKAGIRYDHIMIDEFQDTSRMQWGNFKKLFIENLSQGGDCMLVGDIKQSIYRWRGGDWKILGCIENELRGLPLSISTLNHNYRSEAEIVNFNNKLFPTLADLLGLEEIYLDVEQKISEKKQKAQKGYVRVRIYKKDKQVDDNKSTTDNADATNADVTQEMRMLNDMGEQIERLHALGVDYSDMAILVRTNKEGAKIIAHFEDSDAYSRIPLVSEEAYLLSASPAVQVIVHAMKWLLNPADSIALNYIAKHCETEMRGNAYQWGLADELLIDLLPDRIKTQQEKLREMPLYELTEMLIADFKLYNMEGQHTYLFSFLDYLLKFLDDNASSIEGFIDFWSESLSKKSVQAGGMNGIRILTIHKAKGLDFHTVLLPYHSWEIEPANSQKPFIWCEPKEADFDAMPLLPIKYESIAEHSIYKDDYLAEQKQLRVENLNLLYVAFTRPTTNLLIWSSYSKPSDESSKIGNIGTLLYKGLTKEVKSEEYDEYTMLLQENGQPLPSKHKKDESKGAEKAEEEIEKNPFNAEADAEIEPVNMIAGERSVSFVQSKASLLLQHEDDAIEDEDSNAFIKRGTLLHNILSQIEKPDDFDAAFRWAAAEGLFENRKAEKEARKIISDALNQDVAKEWMAGSWNVLNECSIHSGKLGSTYRPDRVLIRENECIVIDYKFGRPLPTHKSQVAIYMSLLRQMGYSSVKGYLWYPILKKVIEV